jgi:twitching motility protein PilT
LVRQNLGNWKKKYQSIITTESWSTEEERLAFVSRLKERRRFPRGELLDVLNNAYAITDKQKKLEILETVGEVLLAARDQEIQEDLVTALRSTPDPDVRCLLVKIMPSICTDAVIPSLVQMLRHPNRQHHQIARTLLEQFPVDSVADTLAAELIFGTWSDRYEALHLLNEIAPEKVVGACRQTLLIGSDTDRLTALTLLSQIRTPDAVNTLAEHVDDPSDEIRFLLASRFGRIPGHTSVNALIRFTQDNKIKIIVRALKGLCRLADPSSLPAIIRCAEHPNAGVRSASLAALAEIGTQEQMDLLIQGIKDTDIHIRQSALEAITRICSRSEIDGTEMVADLLKDDDVNVRRAAAQILGSINAPKILENISIYLQDSDWWVRESIVHSLSKIKDPGVFPAAVELLQHPETALRRYAVEILISQENPEAVGPLILLLKDPDWWVRERAVVGLGLLASKNTIPLLSKLLNIPALARAAAEALGNIGHPSAVRPLVEHLPQVDVKTKLVILNALEKLHAVDSIPILERYLNNTDPTVRIRAKDVLARLKIDPNQFAGMTDEGWTKKPLSILDTLLIAARRQQATELFLVSGNSVMVRIDGDMMPITTEILTEDQITSMLHPLLNPAQTDRFERSCELVFSHETPGGGRYRGTILRHSTGINLVFRVLPGEIPTLETLKLPDSIEKLAHCDTGLILLTGPAGCGKTSTIAALINRINETRTATIITIEDPVEFVHIPQNCFIIQREVGKHTLTFPKAIRSALREDANVIAIGDIRDADTLWMALAAADSGHLVLASLETPSVMRTLTTIVNAFPGERRDTARTLLSETLQAVISQQLIPQQDSEEPVVALEILINTPTVAGLIRDDKMHQIPSVICTGRHQGMVSMDQSLVHLVRQGLVAYEDACARALDRNRFDMFYNEMLE